MGARREGKALANTGRHNHQLCVAEALHRAETVCKDSGARMTSLRRMVLEQVWRGHDAVKAYDILAWLGRKRRSAEERCLAVSLPRADSRRQAVIMISVLKIRYGSDHK